MLDRAKVRELLISLPLAAGMFGKSALRDKGTHTVYRKMTA
jgi:hypothetical protein